MPAFDSCEAGKDAVGGTSVGAVAIELSYFAKVSSDYVTTTSVWGCMRSSDVASVPFDRPLAVDKD